MAMGKREGEQAPLWIPTTDLPVSPGHPFYVRLNAILDAAGFDAFVEAQCQSFSAPAMGRPSFAPGRYFRLLLVGYFEGLDSAPPPPPPGGPGGVASLGPAGSRCSRVMPSIASTTGC